MVTTTAMVTAVHAHPPSFAFQFGWVSFCLFLDFPGIFTPAPTFNIFHTDSRQSFYVILFGGWQRGN